MGELLGLGGWPMAPIYLCSVVALAVFLRKLIDVRGVIGTDMSWLDTTIEHIEAGDVDAGMGKCRAASHPAAPVIIAALKVAARRPDRVEAEAARAGSLELQRTEKHLGLLAFIAQVAPLLGLLGTVIGMVDLFVDLEAHDGMAGASELSAGIWKALLTTAAGLIVAVPALAGHSYLAARSDAYRLLLHDSVERVVTALPADPSRQQEGSSAV